MSNLKVLDGDGVATFIKATGDGTDIDPHITERLETNSDAIKTAVEGATPAGEEIIGRVGAPDDVVTITPVVAAEVHTGGDLLFDSTEIANAVRVNGYTAIVESIVIRDLGNQKAGMTLIFANAATDFGVPGGVPDPDDTDALTALATVAVVAGDYVDLGANAIATISNIGLLLKAAGGTTSLYMAAITNETPTPASTSDYVIDVALLRS